MSEWPVVSVVIVGWNSRAHLARCLPSLAVQRYPYCEIIVVDNASSDGTCAWIVETYPEVQLLRNEVNIGFAAAVNQGWAVARGEVLVELNPDTTVEPDWLFPLVEVMQWPGVGLATARVMLMGEPERVNACGNEMSLTGLTFCSSIGEVVEYGSKRVQHVPAVSGAAFAMSRECYERIGGFDPDYFAYFEDTDLSWRARLAGFEVVLSGGSVVFHDYAFRFSPEKMYWIERNRHLTLFKHLRLSTLLRLLPALLLGEAIAWGYALMRGPRTLLAKARALGWLLRHTGEVRRRREAVQILREVEDEGLVASMTTTIRFDQTVPVALGKGMNAVIEPFLRWWSRRVFAPTSHHLTESREQEWNGR
ncbi:MAG: glycosyltransferase family 2 protein [Chloroflexota bacterium]|nr:glycosyltransferase family 2 protein [Chloroflexota bacterium]